MKIAVDIDGVLAKQVSAVLSEINDVHGINITKDQIVTYDQALPRIDSSIKEEIVQRISDPHHILGVEPVENSVKAIQSLKREGHDIIIATHRDEETIPASIDWLKYNGIPFNEVQSTSEIGKASLRADLLIDDYPDHIRDFANSGRKAILFSQPWNKNFETNNVQYEGIYRSDDWVEVLNIISGFDKSVADE